MPIRLILIIWLSKDMQKLFVASSDLDEGQVIETATFEGNRGGDQLGQNNDESLISVAQIVVGVQDQHVNQLQLSLPGIFINQLNEIEDLDHVVSFHERGDFNRDSPSEPRIPPGNRSNQESVTIETNHGEEIGTRTKQAPNDQTSTQDNNPISFHVHNGAIAPNDVNQNDISQELANHSSSEPMSGETLTEETWSNDGENNETIHFI